MTLALSWTDVAAGLLVASPQTCLLTLLPDDAAGVFPDDLLSFSAVADRAVIVRLELPDPVTEPGENTPVIPAAFVAAVSVTAELKPFAGVTVTLATPLAPATTVGLVPLSENVGPGADPMGNAPRQRLGC